MGKLRRTALVIAVAAALGGVLPQGSAGAAPEVTYVKASRSVGHHGGLIKGAACPDDRTVVGGGFSNSHIGMTAFTSTAVNNSWQAGVFNTARGKQTMTVWAACALIANPSSVHEVFGPISMFGPGQKKTVQVSCAAGEIALSGGGDIAHSGGLGESLGTISSSEPADGNDGGTDIGDGWSVTANNLSTEDQQVAATAVCIASGIPASVEDVTQGNLPTPNGEVTKSSVTCTSDQFATGVGAHLSETSPTSDISRLYPKGPKHGNLSSAVTAWRNTTGTDQSMTSFAICTDF